MAAVLFLGISSSVLVKHPVKGWPIPSPEACWITNKCCQDTCYSPKMLNHILQVCKVTHDVKCVWHNLVLQHLEQLLHWGSIRSSVRSIIPSSSSFIQSDLVIERRHQLWILDIFVVAGYWMKEFWDFKMEKYGSPNHVAILSWADSSVPVHYLPIIIISNRGLFWNPLGNWLHALGLSHWDIMDFCSFTISYSL